MARFASPAQRRAFLMLQAQRNAKERRGLLTKVAWTIRDLFKNGEQGAAYDPSQIESYKTLGEELVSTDLTSWANNGSAPWEHFNTENDKVTCWNDTDITSVGYDTTNLPVVAGSTYIVSVPVSVISGKCQISLRSGGPLGSSVAASPVYDTSATWTAAFTANATENLTLRLASATGAGATSLEVTQPTFREVTLKHDQINLYQDAAGTTPVLLAGDPVGLMLDTRVGLVRGDELADTDLSGWINEATLPFDTFTAASDSVLMQNSTDKVSVAAHPDTISVVAGQWYECLTYMECRAGRYDISVRSGPAGTVIVTGATDSESGQIRLIFQAPATEAVTIQVTSREGGGAQDLLLTVASVKELPGNHASQPTSAYRYTWQSGLLDDDGVDDNMGVTLPAMAAATVAIARPTGAEITYPVDLSTGSYTVDGDGYGWVILDRELTASEQSALSNWLNARAGL